MTNKQKFENHIRAKVAEGLTEVHYFIVGKPSAEQFYAEHARMMEAEDQSDFEVLGKYSPK
jgi:hypothetical protein